MIRTFVTTIEILPEKLSGTVNDCILACLREKFEMRCFEGTFVRRVQQIIHRGSLVSPRNVFNGIMLCDVQFSAECVLFEPNSLIVATITALDSESIVCETPEYVLYTKLDPTLKATVGLTLIAVIKSVSYEIGTIVCIKAVLFQPRFITQATEVAGALETIPGWDSAVQKFEELQKKIVGPAQNILRALSFTKASKMIFEKKKITEDFKPTTETVIVIINPCDEFGTIRTAPPQTPKSMLDVDAPSVLRKDNCSLSMFRMKCLVSFCNFLEAVLEMASVDFEKNKAVWDFYSKNGNK